MVVGVIAVVAFVCFIWGMIAKTAAVARGLNERSAFWLGFCLWFVGVIIVLASHPERPPAPSPPVRCWRGLRVGGAGDVTNRRHVRGSRCRPPKPLTLACVDAAIRCP